MTYARRRSPKLRLCWIIEHGKRVKRKEEEWRKLRSWLITFHVYCFLLRLFASTSTIGNLSSKRNFWISALMNSGRICYRVDKLIESLGWPHLFLKESLFYFHYEKCRRSFESIPEPSLSAQEVRWTNFAKVKNSTGWKKKRRWHKELVGLWLGHRKNVWQ